MISIQQMEYIVALNEERHFQKASERCFVTQPTLSMQIKKAEDSLGRLVFDRDKTPLELTAFGVELLSVIRDVLRENDRIKELIDKSDGSFREELKIAVIPTIAGYLIPDMYSEWRETLSGVHLTIEEMKTTDLLKAMEDKSIDMAILAGPHNDARLRTIPLFHEEIKAYMPREHGSMVAINELTKSHPWLLTSGNCLRTQMVHFCELENESEEDEWDYEGGNIDLLKRMVELHGGYTLIPENYIKEKSEAYKTITSSTGEVPAREVIAIASHRSRKWEFLELIVRSVQLRYGGRTDANFQILSWK